MDNETLASLLRGRNRAGQPVDATANIIGPAMSALGNTIYGAGRGALTAMVGLPGDINQLITDNLGTLVNAQGLPTTKDIQDFLPLKPTSYEGKLAQKLGEFVPVNPTPIAKGAVAIAKPVGKAMGEQAYRMTEDMLQKQGMMPSIVAYHGTPHNIEGAFDITKVGTGEGAQAYGHGMYYAENPVVAEGYQTKLGQKRDIVVFKDKDGYYIKKGLGEEGENIAGPFKTGSEAEKARVELPQNQGNLYKVDIPDEYVPKMLDWDKPLKEQSDVVRQALGLPEDKFAGFKVPATGTNYSFSPKMTGAEFYKELTDLAKTKAGATEMLNSMGVKGIRYLDEGSRASKITKTPIAQLDAKIDILKKDIDSGLGNRETMERQLKVLQDERARTTKQTSNFVVFDPKEVKILEKNSKPVSRKDIIEEQVNNLK